MAVPRFVETFEFARPAGGRSAALAVVGRRVGALLVAGRADPAGRALRRLGAVGHGGTVSGGVMELAAALSLDEVDPGQLRDRQLLGAARALARTPRALSVGGRAGRRVDRRRADDPRGPSSWPTAVARGESAGDGAEASRPRDVLAHAALGPGDRPGARLAGRGLAQPRRSLPQARPVPGGQACRCSCPRS